MEHSSSLYNVLINWLAWGILERPAKKKMMEHSIISSETESCG